MNNPYTSSGAEPAAMLGRKAVFERLCRHLRKLTPDHVSVIGPKRYGKTVILRHFAARFSHPNAHYIAAAYVDLRHSTPETDDQFRRKFANSVKAALQPVAAEIAEYLTMDDESLGALLQYVFEELQKKSQRLLVVLDSVDHLPLGTGISPNLLDQMRTFAQLPSLRLVTGSRSRLRELCQTEASRTSDFWRIFHDPPLPIGCFDSDDWDDLLEPFTQRSITIEKSARSELENWTGGAPLLVSALLQDLFDGTTDGGTIDNSHVNSVAENALQNHRDLISDLWDDCSPDLQADLADLAAGEVLASDIPSRRRTSLEQRGFAITAGNKLRCTARLIQRFAQDQGGGVTNMRRLFRQRTDFDRNIRSLLELRLSQVAEDLYADRELIGHVKRAIRDLHPDPTYSVVWARSIAERALDLIWRAELRADRKVPDKWINELKTTGVRYWDVLEDQNTLPQERGKQCGVLRWLTGGKVGNKTIARLTRFVTRPTFLLVDHIQSVGNFGQHQDDPATLGFASTVCLAAIELCQSLANDLRPPAGSTTQDP
jgi:hypothetical protein